MEIKRKEKQKIKSSKVKLKKKGKSLSKKKGNTAIKNRKQLQVLRKKENPFGTIAIRVENSIRTISGGLFESS